MNRTFLGLLAAAIGVWCWVGFQIVSLWMASSGQASRVTAQGLPPAARALLASRIPAPPDVRDPFRPFLYADKPAAPAETVPKARPAAVVILPPDVTIDGILMGEPPVAILKKAGATELVKAGQTVWDVTVVKILADQVVLKKQGKTFTLAYP